MNVDILKLLLVAHILLYIAVIVTELQESLDSARAMFRSLAVHSMRQVHDNSRGLAPLGLGTGDEVVDHDLRTVCKVSELGLPNDQGILVGDRVSVFEAEDSVLAQRGVANGDVLAHLL